MTLLWWFHYITLHHITSHHITSHHITSHLISSHHITSHHITSHHITSHHITSHHITLHYITLKYRHFKRHLHLKWPVVHQQLHVIRNTVHRPSTQASYTASRVRLERKISSAAAQIAAILTISFPRWRHMSLTAYWGQQRVSLTSYPGHIGKYQFTFTFTFRSQIRCTCYTWTRSFFGPTRPTCDPIRVLNGEYDLIRSRI